MSGDKSSLIPLVDCDYLTYRAGFAADTQAKEQFGLEGFLQEDYEHYVKHNINAHLTHMFETVFARAPYHKLFLGGPGNYRMNIATTLPTFLPGWKYKGNRDEMHKPKYYAESRQYLQDKWHAELVTGREADDVVSCLQYANPDRSTCIVSQDKDLMNTPGWHYNPVKQEFRYVSKKEADINFWMQVATGDPSDNIPGVYDIGPKKARKLVDDARGEIPRVMEAIKRLYTTTYGPQGPALMHDNANLLWIQRKDWVGYLGQEIEHAPEA